MNELTEEELVESRFWMKVKSSKDGCWEWQAAKTPRGYGVFRGGGERSAHRYSYMIHNGPIPEGAHIMHKCDNPSCVRPDHLEAGTRFDNLEDASSKGRMAAGSRHPRSKLTEKRVLCIVELYKDGIGIMDLSRMFDVNLNTIRQILLGITWSATTGLPRRKCKHNKSTQRFLEAVRKGEQKPRDNYIVH